MAYSFNPFSLSLLTLGLLAIPLALIVLNKLGAAAKWFSLLILSIALWCIAYGLELSSSNLKDMLFWINFEYIGISALPTLWLCFILMFVGREKWLNRRNLILIFLFPAISMLMVWTNGWHHLHYKDVFMDQDGPFPLFGFEEGPWYYIHTIYFYLLIILATVLLVLKFKNSDLIFKKQNGIVLFAVFIPWMVNCSYILGLRPFERIDLTPYAFMATVVLIAIGLLRFKLFDLVPIAKERVIEAMEDGVLVLDAEMKVIDINPKITEVLHSTPRSLVGENFEQIFDSDQKLIWLVKKGIKETITTEIASHGKHRILEVSISHLFDKRGGLSGHLLIFRDITVRYQAELQLKAQSQELEELNQTKNKLFSIIAHDLRSPFASLIEIVNMAQRGEFTKDDFLAVLPALSENLNQTSSLLENLLIWSKNQLQGEKLNPKPFDISYIAEEVIQLYATSAQKKEVNLESVVPKDTTVFADENTIGLVLRNLLGNAIKFSNAGDLVRIDAINSIEENQVTIGISDKGVGIEPEKLDKIFSSGNFSTAGTKGEVGTGLGLLLCQEFVKKNGGKIWVESKLNQGSTFYFTLPTEEIPA